MPTLAARLQLLHAGNRPRKASVEQFVETYKHLLDTIYSYRAAPPSYCTTCRPSVRRGAWLLVLCSIASTNTRENHRNPRPYLRRRYRSRTARGASGPADGSGFRFAGTARRRYGALEGHRYGRTGPARLAGLKQSLRTERPDQGAGTGLVSIGTNLISKFRSLSAFASFSSSGLSSGSSDNSVPFG